MLSVTTNVRDSLLCRPGSCSKGHHDRGSWWQAALRQSGTMVVPRHDNASPSVGRACMVWAGGMAAEEPPFDGVIAVETKAHE